MKRPLFIVLFLVVGLSRLASAENSSPKLHDHSDPNSYSDWYWDNRIGLAGGFAFPAPGSAPPGENRAIVGLETDVTTGPEVGPRFGIATDSSLGFPIGASVADPPTQQLQFFANAKVEYAFEADHTLLSPSFGYGYGILQAAETIGSQTIDEIGGQYLVTGLEVDFHHKFLVNVDYAFSINATRSDSDIANENDNPAFFRARLGVLYRLSDHWLVGAEYVQHGATRPPPAMSSGVFWESQSEALSSLVLQF